MPAPAIHPCEARLAAVADQTIDANLARWHRFAGSPAWIELQALHVRGERASFEASKFAHADDARTAARLASVADRWNCPGVYIIANAIDPAVATRDVAGQWHDAPKGGSTTDAEISARTSLVIDVDAVRPKGTSATEDEMAHTATVATRIHDEIAGILEGDDAIAFAHTGNGRMLFLALASLDPAGAGQRHEAILLALAARYTTERAKIDLSVHDAKRLVPAWGTFKKKGAPGIPSRPHRRTAFTCADEVRRLTLDDLDLLVATLRHGLDVEAQRKIDRALGVKPASTKSTTSGATSPCDPFAAAKAVPVRDVLSWLALVDGERVVCVGCGLSDAGVAVVGNGLKCSHDRCSAKGVRAGFRTTIDVVCEARHVAPIEAVRLMGERFGFEVTTPRSRALEHDFARPEIDPDLAEHFGAGEDTPPPDVVTDPLVLASQPLTGADLSKALPPIDYFVRELAMPRGSGAPHCFGGFGFSGKSVAAQALLLALAADRPVWRVYSGPARALRVSHVDNEQGIALTQRRYQRLALAASVTLADLGDLLRVFTFPKLGSGDRLMLDPAHRSIWRDVMTERDLLLVDSFAASRTGEVKENDVEARRSLDMLGELSEETKCRALVVHHANKPANDDGRERDARFSLRGSGGIFDAFDSVYLLSGSKGEAVKVEQTKARSHGEPVDDLALVIEDVERGEDRRWGLSVRVAGVELIAEQREQKAEAAAAVTIARNVERIRKALAGGKKLSRSDLVSVTRLNSRTFPAAWRALEEAGEGTVETVKDGKVTTKIHHLRGPGP